MNPDPFNWIELRVVDHRLGAPTVFVEAVDVVQLKRKSAIHGTVILKNGMRIDCHNVDEVRELLDMDLAKES